MVMYQIMAMASIASIFTPYLMLFPDLEMEKIKGWEEITLKVFMAIIIVVLWRDKRNYEKTSKRDAKLMLNVLADVSENISRMNGFFDQMVRASVEEKMGFPSPAGRWSHVHDGQTKRGIRPIVKPDEDEEEDKNES